MEAKETVLTYHEAKKIGGFSNLESILKARLLAQAEQTERMLKEQLKQEGRQEVVDWIKQHSQLERCDPDVMQYFNDYLWFDMADWKDKLKSWGIDKPK